MIRNQRAVVYWLCQIAGWTVIFLFNTLFIAIYIPSILRRVSLVYGCASVIAILCTHAYRSFIRRRGWIKLPPLRALSRVALASLAVGVVVAYLAIGIWMLVIHGPYHTGGPGWFWTLPITIYWVVYVFLWSLIYFGFHYFERYRQATRLEVTAKEAQLQGLVAQINPHFMFNCLNSLRGLIAEDQARAQGMVTELSNMLRYSLQSSKAFVASLEAELDIVRSYLKLESIRFEERLSVETDIQPETLSVPMPRMLLQMLVENGVKHGIEKRPEGGRIRISSHLENGAMKIEVTNSGQLSHEAASTRIGLANARERLRLLYGGAATLKLENRMPDSVVAEIDIPVESSSR
jgi:two-component system, LytTR family, sensor kinase